MSTEATTPNKPNGPQRFPPASPPAAGEGPVDGPPNGQTMQDVLRFLAQAQMTAAQAMNSQGLSVQKGMKDVARGMTSAAFIKDIKICGYEATGLQRVTFIKACADRRVGSDHDEAWTCVKQRSTDVPPRCKQIAEQSLNAYGQVVKEAFTEITKVFIFRKRTRTADDIAEEAINLISNYGPVKGSSIHEYYGVARKAWAAVVFVYNLEAEGAKPARATEDSFLRAWADNLNTKMKQHVKLKRIEARNNKNDFSLDEAYGAAQDYLDCDDDSDDMPVSRSMLRKSNLLAYIRNLGIDAGLDDQPRICRFFAKGDCRNGDQCKFTHSRKRAHDDNASATRGDGKRQRNDGNSTTRRGCNKCKSDDHTYSTACPEYAGCKRCNSKEHMMRDCTEACPKCNSEAGKQCDKDCVNRGRRNFRR